jgi:formate dehydrogenase iron-sulfur subunit
MSVTNKGILFDSTLCVGCKNCEVACKKARGFPEASEPELSATALTVVQERAGRNVRKMCMHCLDPACASVCPVGALVKTAAGPVDYLADKCIGCRYCMLACPFGVPRYEWSRLAPYVQKCDMCADRVALGQTPLCVEACPTAAVKFGDRDALLAEAKERIAANQSYVPRIYGAEEAGGTSVLFISDVEFDKLGLPAAISPQPRPALSLPALKEVPPVILVGGSLLAGIYWITQRRQEVALAEARGRSES